MRQKVIVDCDPGIDDALALILAFHSPELEILGISGVNGNVSLAKVMTNIEKILTLIKPQIRPRVARGADCPLQGECFFAEDVHGEHGLGDFRSEVAAGEEWWDLFPGSAAVFLAQTASRHPGEVTLIAIGPLTNLALALRHNPESMSRVKRIVVMGGALREKGNITAHAEFNFFVDPLAAQIVLDSGIPVTLVPLDVTHRVFLGVEEMAKLEAGCGPFGRFLIQATGYDFEKKKFRGGRKAFYLHDSLAVAAVIDPDLFEAAPIPAAVETREGERYGALREAERSDVPAGQRVDVCLRVDGGRFLKMFLSRLGAEYGS